MTDLTDHQVSFLERVFEQSFLADASDMRRFRRNELISLYAALFGSPEGFSETVDTLAFAKLIRPLPSPAAINAHIEITQKGIDFLRPQEGAQITLTVAQKEELATDLDSALQKVDGLPLTQERRAQVRSLLQAARILSEAPEPPVNIIRELLSRADRIINITGFFIGVAGLILSII